jgi:SAM-dependent methyltransferase
MKPSAEKGSLMMSFLRSGSKAFRIISQKRWYGDEPPEGLTWGRVMTGDSLWDLYERYHRFTSEDKILEIGPGYGRLLKTALARNIPFHSYTGLELSKARVNRLRCEFDQANVNFIDGDIDIWRSELKFNIVICSSTFEHLYPDCRAALHNIYNHLAPDANIFIDFIGNIPRKIFGIDLPSLTSDLIRRMKTSLRWFEPSGTYIRIYSTHELLRIFGECGYAVRSIDPCTLGNGVRGRVNRLVVIAQQARPDAALQEQARAMC